MFCKKCGTELRESAKFCAKCGTPVVRSQSQQEQAKPQKPMMNQQQPVNPQQPMMNVQPITQQPMMNVQPRTEKKGVKPWVIILIVVLALAVLAGGGFVTWKVLEARSMKAQEAEEEKEERTKEQEERAKEQEERARKQEETDREKEEAEGKKDKDKEKEETADKETAEQQETLEERLVGPWTDQSRRRVEISLDASGNPIFRSYLGTPSGWWLDEEYSKEICSSYIKANNMKYSCAGRTIVSFELVDDERMIFTSGNSSFVLYRSDEMQVTYATVNPDNADDILPDSSVQAITPADVAGLTKEQLRLARNEIFARHGYIFKDEALAAYFGTKSWYRGTIPADSFDINSLSQLERDNIDVIKAREKELQ